MQQLTIVDELNHDINDRFQKQLQYRLQLDTTGIPPIIDKIHSTPTIIDKIYSSYRNNYNYRLNNIHNVKFTHNDKTYKLTKLKEGSYRVKRRNCARAWWGNCCSCRDKNLVCKWGSEPEEFFGLEHIIAIIKDPNPRDTYYDIEITGNDDEFTIKTRYRYGLNTIYNHGRHVSYSEYGILTFTIDNE